MKRLKCLVVSFILFLNRRLKCLRVFIHQNLIAAWIFKYFVSLLLTWAYMGLDLFTKKQDDQYDENPPQYSYDYGAPPPGNYPNSDDYNTYRACSS